MEDKDEWQNPNLPAGRQVSNDKCNEGIEVWKIIIVVMNEIKFAIYTIKKNIQNSAELRTSFLMNIFGMAINNTAFVLLWVFFVQSVGIVGGWTAGDIIGLQGFVALAFGIVFSGGGGIIRMSETVANGAFDRYLLAPKNLLGRVATSNFRISALGDIVFGIACLAIYAVLIGASIWQILLIVYLSLLASIVFFAAMTIIHSVSFLFIDAHSIVGGFFETFLTPALFHGGAFQGVLRFIFTFVIPSLVVGTLPVEMIKNFSFSNLLMLTLMTAAWMFLAVKVFYFGVRRYESSNLMTFGG